MLLYDLASPDFGQDQKFLAMESHKMSWAFHPKTINFFGPLWSFLAKDLSTNHFKSPTCQLPFLLVMRKSMSIYTTQFYNTILRARNHLVQPRVSRNTSNPETKLLVLAWSRVVDRVWYRRECPEVMLHILRYPYVITLVNCNLSFTPLKSLSRADF